MNIAVPADIEPEPIEIDPRSCELCGCTIDRHERVDTPQGPEFFCEDVEREIYLAALAIVLSWELDDPRDAWKHTGEPRPRRSDIPAAAKPPYRTPQATVDAFWFVVRLGDADRLTEWFSQHPLDAPYLCELWERKNVQS